MRKIRPAAAGAALLLLASGHALAADPVDVALVLAGDVSGSMTDAELRTEREGFAEAFRQPDVLQAIHDGALGRVAVTYIEWAGPSEQWIVAPWSIIGDHPAAEAFAGRLTAAPVAHGNQTAMSSGLLFAARLLAESGLSADRLTIDVAGDGPNNAGPPIGAVRDLLVSRGVTINGLPLSMAEAERGPYERFTAAPSIDLDGYYRDCVIGGPGAFAMPVDDPAQFFAAIRRKLVQEIAALPTARMMRAAYVMQPASPAECATGSR